MFGHAVIPSSQITTSKFSRAQMPSSVRRKDTGPVQARTPLSSPQCARSPSPVRKQNHPSAKMSERYTNREYNRQPSPLRRFQRPGSARSKPEDPPRPTTPSRQQRATLSASRSGVLKQRALETHCSRPIVTPPVRPKTADPLRVGKPLMASASVENRVLLTVKDVLSKAVFEKGRIDENNIENILHDMQARLNIEDDEEESRIALDLEKKTSKTSVNVSNSTENVLLRKQTSFSFVRRQLEPRRASKVYRRIYNKVELPDNNDQSWGNVCEDDKNVVYVDLPDPDYSNFNSLVRRQNQNLKENDSTVSRKQLKPEVAEQQNITEEMVGDYKTKEKSPEIWKSAEDAMLQKHIESLIKNMNNQLSGDHTAKTIEDEIKEKTFCKSICVCKVCVSNKTTSKKILQQHPSQGEEKAVTQSGSKLKSSVKGTNLDLSKARVKCADKAPNTESSTRMKFKILKKNQNFQPESKISISARTHVNKPSSNKSYTVMGPPMDEEAEEDLYLQRRISRAPVGRRTTSRM